MTEIVVRLNNFKLVNEANASSHRFVKGKRAKSQREAAQLFVLAKLNERSNAKLPDLKLPVTVTLTRIAPRKFDDDGLSRSFKAVRDGVADALLPHNRGNQSITWADDDDGQIIWEYEQRKGDPKQHAVGIRVAEIN